MRRRFIHIYNKICEAFKTALQYNKTIVDGVWQDELGKHDGVARQGAYYYLNGVDNYLRTGDKITGGTPIIIENTIKGNVDDDYLTFCGGDLSTNSGFRSKINYTGNYIFVQVSSGVDRTDYTFNFTSIPVDLWNVIVMEWSGISGEDMTITVNGEVVSKTINRQWSGDSNTYLTLYAYVINPSEISVSHYALTYNGNARVESYCEQEALYDDGVDSNLLLTKTIGATHLMDGDVTSFFGTDNTVESNANEVGWSTCDSLPGVIIPLNSELNPVITCV